MSAIPIHFSPLSGVLHEELPNGLRLILKPDQHHPLISIHAWVRVGSVDEISPQAGISHIVEHMVFKGTRQHKALEIARFVESMGGSINAETTKEYTHYYIDVPSAGAERATSLMGELMHRATFEAREWARECPVILEEIKRRNDDPESVLWDVLGEALYEDEHLRRSVIGSPETVAAQTAKSLFAFYRSHYTARRMVLSIAGDFQVTAMKRWIHNAFHDMPTGAAHVRPPLEAFSYRARHLQWKRPVQQAYGAYAFPTPPAAHPDHEALDILAGICGEGRNSRLTHDLREDKKIVWSISAANITQEGPGMFAIFTESDASKLPAVKKGIQRVMQTLLTDKPSAKELTRAKNMIQSSWLQGFETYHNYASTLGLYALENNIPRLVDYLPRILSVTQKELQGVINRYVAPSLLSSALVRG